MTGIDPMSAGHRRLIRAMHRIDRASAFQLAAAPAHSLACNQPMRSCEERGLVHSFEERTMKSTLLIASAVASALALPMLANAGPASEPSFKAEKCYGINAAGKNDCASSNSHSCAGEAKQASDPKSWIYVPVGTCTKIQGGATSPKA
jgi:uncharacterized membrane protein